MRLCITHGMCLGFGVPVCLPSNQVHIALAAFGYTAGEVLFSQSLPGVNNRSCERAQMQLTQSHAGTEASGAH